jgi:putative transposase
MSALTHFITASTFHRKRLFHNERYGELLTDCLMRWRGTSDVLLHDYVIMPDHIHLLITVSEECATVSAVQQLQATFAKDLGRQYGYSGEIWEPNFRDVEVRDLQECERCTRMIHSNPVRVGFCEKPTEYRMSSKASRWVLDPLPEDLQGITAQAI